jgi:DNA replication protein DnaC
MAYDKAVLDKLRDLKEKIVSSCSVCSGNGYVFEKSEDVPCVCMQVFIYIKQLILAGIAKDYWCLELQSLRIADSYKTLLQKYLDNYANAEEKSLGFLFMGTNGVGKTACLAELGKEAIIRGQSVKYITAESYIKEMSFNSIYSIDTNVILLDELDKAYIKEGSSFVPKRIEDLIRKSIGQGAIVHIATNMDSEGLTEMFGDSFFSMLQRHLKLVPFKGEDFSQEKQQNWFKDLTTSFSYMHPVIVKSAQRKREHNK